MTTMTLDISQTPSIPFARLCSVELRKAFDTRAGRWLVIGTGLVTALVLVIQLWVVLAQDLVVGLNDFMLGVNTPMAIFLPVLGVMLVTSEWSQRTALVTFTQVPSRAVVVAAKFVAAVLIATTAVVVGLALASAANLIYGAASGNEVVWGLDAEYVARWALLHVIGLSTGFAFGVLFLNTPVAIVLYLVYSFVLPPLLALGAALLEWFGDLQPWVDFSFAQQPLLDTKSLTGEQWAQLGVSGLIWLGIPLAIGLWRVLRAEVK